LNTNVTTNTLSKDLKYFIFWKKSLTPHFHTPQTFNESKNSLPHTFSNFKIEILNNSKNSLSNTFTLKLDTLKNLNNEFFSHLKNLQHLEEISSTTLTHLEMDSYYLCNLANLKKKPSLKRILPLYAMQAKL
jgi:uncharacterized protein YjfI (DUF2170 family)